MERPKDFGFFKKRAVRKRLYNPAHCRLQAESFVSLRGLFIRKGRAGRWKELGRGQRAETSRVNDSVIR